MLFNPPMVKTMVLEIIIIYIIDKEYVKEGGYIVLVLRKQDMIDCLELML